MKVEKVDGNDICPNPSCDGRLGYEIWTPKEYRNGVPLSFECLTCNFRAKITLFALSYGETKEALNEQWAIVNRRRQSRRARNVVQCL